MFNKIQKNILPRSDKIELLNIEKLNQEYLAELSKALGKELTQNTNSNAYIMANAHNKDLVACNDLILNILQDINGFFDYNRFDGYKGGSYDGIRNALLELGFFEDVKIAETNTNATVQVILLYKDEVLEIKDSLSFEIAKCIHENRSLGTLTLGGAGSVSQTINASSGEAKTYNWFLGNKKVYDVEVKYYLDFEETFTNYDFNTLIVNEIKKLYGQNYGSLGKDIKIQDFYSITRNIKGISKVDVTFVFKNPDDTETRTTNQDIAMGITEIFMMGKIKTIQGN
jgi:hypothetical protein